MAARPVADLFQAPSSKGEAGATEHRVEVLVVKGATRTGLTSKRFQNSLSYTCRFGRVR